MFVGPQTGERILLASLLALSFVTGLIASMQLFREETTKEALLRIP